MSPRAASLNGLAPFRLRRVTHHDIDVLAKHRHAMWEDIGIDGKQVPNWGDKVYKRWTKTRLKSQRLIGWLVEDKAGNVAGSGCVWLQPIQPRPHHRNSTLQPYLLSMYVEKNFRRRGVASLIVNEAIVWCKKNDYQRITLHSSEMGRRLYAKFGFKRTWEMKSDVS